MWDVAKYAGVAQSTVSRFLNGTATVSPQIGKRIAEAIQILDYRPNQVARNLKKRATNTIALFVPDITNLFYAELSKGVSEEARRWGLEVILYDTGYHRSREKDYLELALRQQIEGIVIAYNLLDEQIWLRLGKSKIPAVLIDVYPPDDSWTALVVDNEQGIRLAIDCLRSLGHRQVAYLSEPPYVLPLILRQREYMRYMREQELLVKEKWMLTEKKQLNRVKIGFNLGRKLIENDPIPTAVMTSSDLVAVGALYAFLSAGLRVPEEISLIGFDDIILSSYLFPSLTTVRQPKYEMGLRGVRLLMNLISKPGRSAACFEIIEPTLVARNSTGPARPVEDGR
ncbi:MAG TPA: LacI family DNA-binding transcriptional regulator [Atribacteraceae bacterium]|nr:LacI family DNA-binding transcriptional regulator [Atribacteraceae bacterium]